MRETSFVAPCFQRFWTQHFESPNRLARVTALETEQPMLKQLPDAPRDFDENASDLVVVTGGGRYLYRNEIHADGTIVPAAYAMRDPSEALLCSTAKMVFTTTEMAAAVFFVR